METERTRKRKYSDECGSREEPKKNVENRFTFTEKYMDALFLL